MLRLGLLVALVTSCACASEPARVPAIADGYLARYFELYPSRATSEGLTTHDAELERLTDERIREWIRYQDEVDAALKTALTLPGTTDDDRIDAEVLQRQTARERHELVVLRRHEYDPLFWTGLAANAVVLQVVREGRPVAERVAGAVARVEQIPVLVAEATRRILSAPDDRLSPELCRLAASQAQAAAVFYRSSFPSFAATSGVDATAAATAAANALATFGNLLDSTSLRASGSPRLERHYARTLEVHLGIDESPAALLTAAERDLLNLRQEAAAYGRSVWRDVMGNRPMPAGEVALLRALFARIAEHRDADLPTYVATWRATIADLERFVRHRAVITLPASMELVVAESPAYFIGQSIGGQAAPGPYAPDAPTVLFLPVPRPDATPEQRTAFFRDFNRPFNRMIAPHELIPGHYVQSYYAARHPRRVRAVFPDQVYVEGWGTFCERLLLDLGWGGPLERLAHLKKQLENVARTIVDIRVHTDGMSRDDVLRFVQQTAVQDDQFARNLWTRAITASPQMLAYHFGYRRMREIHDLARRQQGEAFVLRAFADDMMALGPVGLRHYRARVAQ